MREKFISLLEKKKQSLERDGWVILNEKIQWRTRMAVLTLRRTPIEKKIILAVPHEVYTSRAPFTELREVEIERRNRRCLYCGAEIKDDNWGYENPYEDNILCGNCWNKTYGK